MPRHLLCRELATGQVGGRFEDLVSLVPVE